MSKQSRNFFGGVLRSPASGQTTVRSSTRLQECDCLKFLLTLTLTHPSVDKKPETVPSAKRETMSPTWSRLVLPIRFSFMLCLSSQLTRHKYSFDFAVAGKYFKTSGKHKKFYEFIYFIQRKQHANFKRKSIFCRIGSQYLSTLPIKINFVHCLLSFIDHKQRRKPT